MNTLNHHIPIMQPSNSRDYVVMLEDLEFGISKQQLNHITDLHMQGMEWEDISQETKRDVYEVLVALIVQAKHGRIMPAFRHKKSKGSLLLVPGKEQLKHEALRRRKTN